MSNIKKVNARQIIDSRGNPTIEVDVTLEDSSFGRAAVPSGASTGSLEAHELRDNDNKAYNGKGVLKAVESVKGEIADNIIGKDATKQRELDNGLIELDGTDNKKRLGANSILGVSLACAKAAANSLNIPLYQHLGGKGKRIMPVPMMNILNGGAHADNKVDVQEFMIMPIGAKSCSDSIRIGAEIFHSLKKILKDAGHNTNVGDEGGFAPALDSSDEALSYIMKAIEAAKYTPEEDIVIALDSASTEFYKDGKYVLEGENKILSSDELIKYYEDLVAKYPIKSIEDAMSEDDYEGWANLTKAIGNKVQLVGDDLFVTNPKILQKGIDEGLANSILIKVNQIGTLTETIDAINLAKDNNYNSITSHRSGETEDATISHIAVGLDCGQIKTGSLCRSDRLAKYNELIRIEEILGSNAIYDGKNLFT